MKYNFDEIIDRHNTGAIKIEKCKALFGTDDLIPLWVADMDFRTPDFITNSIAKRLEHPILGYTTPCEDYFKSVIHWIEKQHQWKVDRQWFGFLPGIVPGLAFGVNAFTQPNDEIIVQPPVYPPFLNVPTKNDRKVVFNPLKEINGRFEMDFDDLERKITGRTRLFILCNPHNPGGVSGKGKRSSDWPKSATSTAFWSFQTKYIPTWHYPATDIFPLPPYQNLQSRIALPTWHRAKLSTWQGLSVRRTSFLTEISVRRFSEFLENSELANGNIFAYFAAKAAYENGSEWLKQMIQYIQGNLEYVVDFLQKNIPQIVPMIPQASFLVWLDCNGMNMNSNELQDFMVHKAGLGLNKGTTFGPGGERRLRLNIGCPRSILEQAMKQLKKAIDELD